MTVDPQTLKFSPAQINAEGLTLNEYQMICDRLYANLSKKSLIPNSENRTTDDLRQDEGVTYCLNDL